MQRNYIANAKCEPFKGIYINLDLSIKERNAQKQLHEELKRRKDAGEAHLKSVHGRIVNSELLMFFLMKYFHLIITLTEKTGSLNREVVCLFAVKIQFPVWKCTVIVSMRLLYARLP